MKSTVLMFFVISVVGVFLVPSTDCNQAFNAAVYKKLSTFYNGNFFVSPVSVETLLTLTLAGSKDDTAEELRRSLDLTDGAPPKSTVRNLISISENRNYTLKVANKLYTETDFPVNDDFKKVATEDFDIECESLEFQKPKEAAYIANSWVMNQTNHKIQNLILPSSLHFRTKLLLLNALYFKANWSKAFPVMYTQKQDFHVSKTEKIQVDRMVRYEEYLNFYEDPQLEAKFLELPFQGDEASLVIVLPNEIDGLSKLEAQIEKVFQPHKFTTHFFNVALPKFRFDTKVNFKKILKKMGVRKIFDRRYADLSGISGRKGDLIVDQIAQKTFIDVSEEGLEAAAATYYIELIQMNALPEEPKDFIVDRPFMFYIKIKDVVVFVGRVTRPQ